MAGEQPIRPRKSLALGLDDCTLLPLASTRYSSLDSTSTTTSLATPVSTSLVNSLSLGHYLGSSDEFLLMCRLRLSGTQISFMLNPLLPSVLSISDFCLMIHVHVPHYFFESTMSLPSIDNLETEILFVDAHSTHHFIDESTLIAVLPPLTITSSINQSTEDIDEGFEEGSKGEHNNEGRGSSGSDLKVVRYDP
ncbi:hypothetical protein M9H77_35917 [Catharanthus roseus]|uniref:Uncharacterized protein n=1 Tax=Catharanthus roseus TaxID=4058 RepID=A0ACB9ZQB8_CATRO|nr:hypothetical protein M9H77_35917 [Catharanthus roseus]